MRPTDRLFHIIQILRTGRLTTARTLAAELEVSERTIYRDVAQLIGAGVPIDGAAGAGYLMRDGYDVPPLMFDRAEIEALVIGARMAQAWAGTKTGMAARTALGKIEAVIPGDLKLKLRASPLYAPDFAAPDQTRDHLDLLHQAVEERRIVRALYRRLDDAAGERDIQPLGLFYWGKVWTLAGWCELRGDFRNFRVDRFDRIETTDRCFPAVAGRTLRDFFRAAEAQCADGRTS